MGEKQMEDTRDSDGDDEEEHHHHHHGNGKYLHPTLYSERRVSSRKSLRTSSNEEDYRYRSVRGLMIDFCQRTSSHGIPFLGSTSFFGWPIWTCIFLVALTSFSIQTYWTLKEYFQFRTIIEMQLSFQAAPFPAATVCNLNAFKHSELIQYSEIKEGFDIWENAINNKQMQAAIRMDGKKPRGKREDISSSIEEMEGAVYSPIFVKCTCMNTEQCVPNRNPLEVNASVCMCFEDVTKGLIWPCYPLSVWSVKNCTRCSISNTCSDPDHQSSTSSTILSTRSTTVNTKTSRPRTTRPRTSRPTTKQPSRPCLCQSISHHCMLHPKDEIKWWNPNNYTIYPVTQPPTTIMTETEEAYGLNDLTDKGAITTQTKENLIFLVAALPRETRVNLSYSLDEFVLRCSFNSKDCDMEKDFKLHVDPEYGNCYTFNFNDSVELLNTRAGPMYGLRLLLDVHQNDYMPTTEAAGVRLVVHEQDQEPFPDTFGYSAPTGFISSFGLKTKMLHRLGTPYGQCSDTFRPENYIYDEHYSPEGCHRNCFQLYVLETCKCGDPRFPLPNEYERHCSAKSVSDRRCLSNVTIGSSEKDTGYHHLKANCTCTQPCTENVFETAYSAAAWPSINFIIGQDCPAVSDIFNDSAACSEYYRLNTAYIEIYYEQLNYETLKETAGYTNVNLFSDFGGNIGLWIGFSVITMCEIIELILQLIYYTFWIKPRRVVQRINKKKNDRRQEKVLTLPQILQQYIYTRRTPTPSMADDIYDE